MSQKPRPPQLHEHQRETQYSLGDHVEVSLHSRRLPGTTVMVSLHHLTAKHYGLTSREVFAITDKGLQEIAHINDQASWSSRALVNVMIKANKARQK